MLIVIKFYIDKIIKVAVVIVMKLGGIVVIEIWMENVIPLKRIVMIEIVVVLGLAMWQGYKVNKVI